MMAGCSFRLGKTALVLALLLLTTLGPWAGKGVEAAATPEQAYQIYELQNINTPGGVLCNTFTLDNVVHLVVANYKNPGIFLTSQVYRYNATTQQFDEIQSIATEGANAVEAFTIDNVVHLVVANYEKSSGGYALPSPVYRYNATTKLFDLLQSINTIGAIDVEAFTMDNVMHLAFASHRDNAGYLNLPTQVYRYNASTQQFDLIYTVVVLQKGLLISKYLPLIM